MNILKFSPVIKAICVLIPFIGLAPTSAFGLLAVKNATKYPIVVACPQCSAPSCITYGCVVAPSTALSMYHGGVASLGSAVNITTYDTSMPFPYNHPNQALGNIFWQGDSHASGGYCETATYALAFVTGTTQPTTYAGAACTLLSPAGTSSYGFLYKDSSQAPVASAIVAVITAP